jgi:hypothetical protein
LKRFGFNRQRSALNVQRSIQAVGC